MSKLVKETDLKSVGACPLEGSIPSSRIYLIVVGLEASILNECGELPLACPDYIIPQDEKRIKATPSSDVMVSIKTNQLK